MALAGLWDGGRRDLQQRHIFEIRGSLDHLPPQRFRLPKGYADLRSDLGATLRARRKSACIKQHVLADTIGVTREALSRIETGRSWPRPQTLDLLLVTLELDWPDVADRGEPKRSSRISDTSRRSERCESLGHDLRAGRREKGWSLRELSKRSGLSAAQLSRLERGEVLRSAAIAEDPDDAELEFDERQVAFRNPVLAELVALAWSLETT